MVLLKKVTSLFMIFLLFSQCKPDKQTERPQPLEAKPVVNEYFGKKITDPYQFMEELDPVVVDWIKAESDYAKKILESIAGRQELINKMKEFDKRRTTRIYSTHITDNDKYFYLKLTPDDETGKLFFRDGYGGKEILLYDPATFSTDSTHHYSISEFKPSDEGTRLAFGVSANGSESSICMVMDVETKELFPEKIDRCWLTDFSWLPDGSAFLYNRLNSSDVHDMEREMNSKAFLHKVGTDPAVDKEIFSREKYPELNLNPEDFPSVTYHKEANTLFAFASTVDSRLRVFYTSASELMNETIHWKTLFKLDDNVYNFKATTNDIYIYTPKNAPHFKIVKTSLLHPDLKTAETVIPEDPEKSLTSFSISNEGLYYTLSNNGVEEQVFRKPLDSGPPSEIKLPFRAGSAYVSTKGFNFSDVWVEGSGWSHSNIRYRYSATSQELKEENLSSIPDYPEYHDLVVEEIMVPSHDGTLVPLSLIYNKGTKRDGNNPVFFYGYGAYGYSMTPFFSPSFLLWTQYGGILAFPHVRGGSELGENWYLEGKKTTKPNTWKDLIACAEYLIKKKYTSAKKIAINGGSAGGILIGRAMTERPDLFAVAIPEVGCLNTVRAELSPNGPVNVPEFGTVNDSTECMALIEMDSYHHIQKGVQYPATLITAGMNDPRVIVWEPAKFAAQLLAANTSDKPVLFYTDFEAGHGMGNSKTKAFESLANVLSFAFWQTGHPQFQINP